MNDDEIRSLVFANREAIPDVGNKGSLSLEEAERVRLVAGMLFHCFDVFGSEKKALYWLHQPIARFHRQSPLQFLDASSNIEEVEEYLTQIEEGNFA